MREGNKLIQREILNRFQESLRDMSNFSNQLAGVDSRFGQMEQRIASLHREVLSGLDTETLRTIDSIKRTGLNFRPTITSYLSRELARINQALTEKIRSQINSQLQQVLRQINQMGGAKIDPFTISQVNGNAPSKGQEAGESAGKSSSGAESASANNFTKGFGFDALMSKGTAALPKNSPLQEPVTLLTQAMDSLKAVQAEQLKALPSLALKKEFMTADGKTDFGKANQAMEEIKKDVRAQAMAYGVDFVSLWQAATAQMQNLKDPKEVSKFTESVAVFKTLDPSLENKDIISGLESLTKGMGGKVSQLDQMYEMLFAASSVTKQSPKDVLLAAKDTGEAFKDKGFTIEQMTALAGVAGKKEGGVEPKDAVKDLLLRLSMPNIGEKMDKIGVRVYKTDPVTHEKTVKTPGELFAEFINLYKKSDGGKKQELINTLFDNPEQVKGLASIKAMNKYVESLDKAEQLKKDQFVSKLMVNNMQSPTVAIQRSGVAMYSAFESVLEELIPEMVSVSDGLTNLANIISNNSGVLGQLIRTIGTIMVGFAAWKMIKPAVTAVGREAEYYRNTEELLGRGSNKSGKLDALRQDVNGKVLVGSNVLNEKLFVQAFKNTELAPHMEKLTNLTNAQVRSLAGYIKDYNIRVNNLGKLIALAEESKGYQPKPELTDEKKQHISTYNAKQLTKFAGDELSGINPIFASQFERNLSSADAAGFTEMMNDNKTKKAINGLSGMSDEEMKNFSDHLKKMHRESGKVITNVDGLANALRHYSLSQRNALIEARQSSPEFVKLSQSFKQLGEQINSDVFTRGFKKMTGSLTDIRNLAKGAMGAFTGLAAGAVASIGQMAAMYVLGQWTEKAVYGLTTSEKKKKMDTAENNLTELDLVNNYKDAGFWAKMKTWYWDTPMHLLGAKSKDGLSTIDLGENVGQLAMYMRKEYNPNFGLDPFSMPEEAIIKLETEYKKAKGNDKTFSDLIEEYKVKSGKQKEYDEARRNNYISEFDKNKRQDDQDKKSEEIASDRYQKKLNQDMKDGKMGEYSTETFQGYYDQRMKDAKEEKEKELSNLLAGGKGPDSIEYLNKQKEKLEVEKQVHNELITMIDNYIKNLEQKLKDTSLTKTEREKIEVEMESKTKLRDSLNNQFQQTNPVQMTEIIRQQQRIALDKVKQSLAQIDAEAESKELLNSIYMDRNSREFVQQSITDKQGKISKYKRALASLQQMAFDSPEEKAAEITELNNKILSERVQIKDLKLQSIGLHEQKNLRDRAEQREVDYLTKKVRTGITDDNNPILRNLRINQYREQVNDIQKVIADLKEQAKGKQGEEAEKYQQQIKELLKQSLQAQIGMLDAMKNTGGTFNMPDNVKVMSQYDYMSQYNSHKTFSVQSGDMNIQVTLPNVTGLTDKTQLMAAGQAIAASVAQNSRLGNQYKQGLGQPWLNYR